jgi:hypothetical protein
MHGIFFYIGLGAGLAAACGLRPFLPLLLAGALASSGSLGITFSGEPFHFLQEGWGLLVVAVALVLAYACQLLLQLSPTLDPGTSRTRPDPLAAALSGLGLGAGAVLFAGTLAAHHDAWWPGVIGGLLAAALGQSAVAPVISRARLRLPERGAREALTIYLDAASLVMAALVCVLYPLGYDAVGLLAWLALGSRARSAERFAGLRILRR